MTLDLDLNSVTVTKVPKLDIGEVTVTSLGVPGNTTTTVASPNEKRAESFSPDPNASFVMIDTFWIDVFIKEDHTFTNEVTDFPVESGGSISDNIRPRPTTLTVEGVVSNTPVSPQLVQRNESYGKKSAEFAYALLLSVWNRRDTVTIRTSLATFKNMALEELSIPRSAGHPDAFIFTAKFKQIKTTTNARTVVRTSTPICRARKKVNKATPIINPFGVKGLYINKRTGIWFDPHINSWRYAASWDRDQAFTSRLRSFSDNHEIYSPASGIIWVVVRGRPLGITKNEWETLVDMHHSGDEDPALKAILPAHFASVNGTEVPSGATGFNAAIRGAWADIILVPSKDTVGYFTDQGATAFTVGNVE